MAGFDAITLAQFWGRVTVTDSGSCWEWRGPIKSNGYGRFNDGRAHRFAFELINGPIPDGMVVRHRCDNRLCCNPRHLLLGTQADNIADAVERDRIARRERQGNAKLTAADALYIRQNPDRMSGRALAAKFGVSPATVSGIRSGKIWT